MIFIKLKKGFKLIGFGLLVLIGSCLVASSIGYDVVFDPAAKDILVTCFIITVYFIGRKMWVKAISKFSTPIPKNYLTNKDNCETVFHVISQLRSRAKNLTYLAHALLFLIFVVLVFGIFIYSKAEHYASSAPRHLLEDDMSDFNISLTRIKDELSDIDDTFKQEALTQEEITTQTA